MAAFTCTCRNAYESTITRNIPPRQGDARFVEMLHAAGADTIVVAPIYGKRRKLFADWVLVELPSSPPKRCAVRNL